MRDAKSHQPISIANSCPNHSGLLREWIFCRPVTPPPRGFEVLAVSQISVATTLHPSLNLFGPSSPVGFSARLLLLLRWPSPRTRMSLPRLFPTESFPIEDAARPGHGAPVPPRWFHVVARPNRQLFPRGLVALVTIAGQQHHAGPGSADYSRPRPAVLKALVLVLGRSCRLLLLSSRTLLRARCVKLGRAPPTTLALALLY